MKTAAIITVIAVIAVAAAIAITRQPTGQISAQKEVKVGAILALTGDFSIFGNSLREGLELAADELNRRGDIKYRLVVEDDGNVEIRKAVEASRKLIDVDRVDVSVVTAANEGKSLMPIFEESRTPLVVLFDTNKALETGSYTFATGFSTEDAAKEMAEFAYRNLSVRNASIVYSFDDWSALISSAFKEEFEALGGKVVLFEGTQFEETDFRTLVVKSKSADAIYVPTVIPNHIVRQAKELGYHGHVLTADGFNQDQIDASGTAAEGVYFTNVYLPDSEKLQHMLERYRSKFGKEPEIVELTAVAYDAMHAIDAAVREKGVGREQIKEGLYEIRIEGTTGTVDFDETGMSPRFERIFVVKDGKAVLVE